MDDADAGADALELPRDLLANGAEWLINIQEFKNSMGFGDEDEEDEDEEDDEEEEHDDGEEVAPAVPSPARKRGKGRPKVPNRAAAKQYRVGLGFPVVYTGNNALRTLWQCDEHEGPLPAH